MLKYLGQISLTFLVIFAGAFASSYAFYGWMGPFPLAAIWGVSKFVALAGTAIIWGDLYFSGRL
jgi:hypothetical protein